MVDGGVVEEMKTLVQRVRNNRYYLHPVECRFM